MNLNEAIDHCRQNARSVGETSCGLEHRQLAEWLIELRDYRHAEVAHLQHQVQTAVAKVSSSMRQRKSSPDAMMKIMVAGDLIADAVHKLRDHGESDLGSDADSIAE